MNRLRIDRVPPVSKKPKKLEQAIIYCDGACSGNPGPGGWGSIVLTPDLHVRELGGHQSKTTNNQMELEAATAALKTLSGTYTGPITVYTDSVYVIRGITQWIFGWMKRGWQTAEGNEVSNQEYWEILQEVVGKLKKSGCPISWKYTRGHMGTPGNERCDTIAVAFSKREFVELYNGSADYYHFNILDLPADQPLPEMTSKSGPKASPHSYLSVIGGIALRHKSWPDCERRVKGQAGARFKKAMSAQEEQEILKGWGVNPGSVKDA